MKEQMKRSERNYKGNLRSQGLWHQQEELRAFLEAFCFFLSFSRILELRVGGEGRRIELEFNYSFSRKSIHEFLRERMWKVGIGDSSVRTHIVPIKDKSPSGYAIIRWFPIFMRNVLTIKYDGCIL